MENKNNKEQKDTKMSNDSGFNNAEDIIGYLSDKAREEKTSKKRFYHYTTFDSLLSILSNKTFQMTRTDKLNDKAETKIGDKNKAYNNYIMSYTEKKEYISMWAMYGRSSGIKLRLSFLKENLLEIIDEYNYCPKGYINEIKVDDRKILKKEDLTVNLWEEYYKPEDALKLAYVTYLDKEKKQLKYNTKFISNSNMNSEEIKKLTGFVKYDAWEFEKEIRLLVTLNDNKYEHVFLPITDKLIKSFSITFNPWLSDELKDIIRRELDAKSGYSLHYINSDNDGEVDETRI